MINTGATIARSIYRRWSRFGWLKNLVASGSSLHRWAFYRRVCHVLFQPAGRVVLCIMRMTEGQLTLAFASHLCHIMFRLHESEHVRMVSLFTVSFNIVRPWCDQGAVDVEDGCALKVQALFGGSGSYDEYIFTAAEGNHSCMYALTKL